MAKRQRPRRSIGVNLPIPAKETWDIERMGYPHTMFTMAALAAFRLLDQGQKASLMPLVGYADEKKGLDGSWDAVLAWCEAQKAVNREHLDKLDELLASEHRAQNPPAARRKKTAGRCRSARSTGS